MTLVDADNIWEKIKAWINFEFKKFLNEEQDPEAVRKVLIAINPMLIEKEKILYIAVEKKPFINWLPDALIVTTRRCIQYQRTLFGFNLIEDKWRKIVEVTIEEGLWGSRVQVISPKKPGQPGYMHWDVKYLPKKQAQELYAVTREMTYRGRRKQRMRTYQENISKVPHIMINSSGGMSHDIFEGLIPPDKVPAVARGMGFVELSEAIDGRGGRSVVPDVDEDTIRQLDEEIRLGKSKTANTATQQQQSLPPATGGNGDGIQEVAPPSFAMGGGEQEQAAPASSRKPIKSHQGASMYIETPSARQLNQKHQERIAQIRAEGQARRAAKAGTPASAAPTPATPPPAKRDPLAELKKLKDQLKAGSITDEEYEKRKAEVLSTL